MKKLAITRDAFGFLDGLEAKQYRQVGQKMLALLVDSQPNDASKLKGYDQYYRVDSGEYRIVYRFDDETIFIVVIAKRNDDEVYKALARK